MPSLPPEVIDYRERGWSLIPMRMKEKRPAYRWKRYQREAASDSTIRRWFAGGENGVGVVFGDVSQGLASRDFDEMDAYRHWASNNPTYARTLPTVATLRGMHVYCLATPESVLEARRRLQKPLDGTGAIHLPDGELRAGVGCYSVLPPSTHPSGHLYRWEVPLPDGPLPLVDLIEADFLGAGTDCHACNRESQRAQRSTEAIDGGGGEGDSEGCEGEQNPELSVAIQTAINCTVPTAPGQRHRQVFELCRALRAIPELSDADPGQLKLVVREWHRLALPVITSKPFEETWIDFLKGWPNVRYPRGEEPMATIFKRACSEGLPPESDQFEQPELQLLIGLCRELQREAGDGPFYLSCRTAGRLLGVNHTTANRWLFLLVKDGVLAEIEKGDHRKRRASRFRYLGKL